MGKINKFILIIISVVVLLAACNKNTSNTNNSYASTNDMKNNSTDSSLLESNEIIENNEPANPLVRHLDYIDLIDYNRETSPSAVKEGDTFLDMYIKEVVNREIYENDTWKTTYAMISIEGNVSLSGKLILGDPIFFLPDETSLSMLPRFYQDENIHCGIMISNLDEVMPWLKDTFSINEDTEEMIIDNVILNNYALTMRAGIGNEETGNIVSVNGYEVDILKYETDCNT